MRGIMEGRPIQAHKTSTAIAGPGPSVKSRNQIEPSSGVPATKRRRSAAKQSLHHSGVPRLLVRSVPLDPNHGASGRLEPTPRRRRGPCTAQTCSTLKFNKDIPVLTLQQGHTGPYTSTRARQRDSEIARRRDGVRASKARQRDGATARRRDSERPRLRDSETARRRDGEQSELA